MSEIKFEIKKRIGIISETSNTSLELNLVSWNNGTPKYDLRKWGGNGTKPYKGITLNLEELMKINEILSKSILLPKSNIVKYQSTFGRASAEIYEVLGEYKSSKSMPGKITYTSWGGVPKYDIRPWKEDFSVCGKGVSMNESECGLLISFIKKELNLDNDEDYDTSDIDDLLIL